MKAAVDGWLKGQSLKATPGQPEAEFRRAEYTALSSEAPQDDDEFVTAPQPLNKFEPWVCEYFDRVVLVERLAETRALLGFARVDPPPARTGTPDMQRMFLFPPKQPNRWLPAVRVYGEGIFLRLRREALDEWAKREQVVEVFSTLQTRLNQTLAERKLPPRTLRPWMLLLHAMAHAVIRRLSFNCGYGSSSIRERIYSDEGTGEPMAGVLVYTAAGDSEGTMGGLVRQGKPGKFEPLFRRAVIDASWCNSDPICVESPGQGSDSLNLAACHACLLLPETCCEEGNRLLDRSLLVGKSAGGPQPGFFTNLADQLLARVGS